MGLKDDFRELIAELEKFYSGDFSYNMEFGIPNFVTAKNGLLCQFTHKAQSAINSLSNTIYINNSNYSACCWNRSSNQGCRMC